MEPAAASVTTPHTTVFQDGLGERRRMADPNGNDTLEVLCLRTELTSVPSFEFALRERVSRLASFRHTYYSRVRSVDRLNQGSTLALVSECASGVRLSDVLAAAERKPAAIDINAALHLVRQLVSAVALLHENARDVAHGAIGPERVVITPNARLVIVEYVMGAALEQLRFSHERYWKELRIALPRSGGLPRFDHRADVTQIGVVALSLVLGRLLHDDEYPGRIGDVLASAWAISSQGGFEPLPPGLRTWLGRALQLDARNAFASALEARNELDKVLSGDCVDDMRASSAPPPSPAAAAPAHQTPASVPERPAPVQKTAPAPPAAVAPPPAPAAASAPAPPPSTPAPSSYASAAAAAPAPTTTASTTSGLPVVHDVGASTPAAKSEAVAMSAAPRAILAAPEEAEDADFEPAASEEAPASRGWTKIAAAAVAFIVLAGGGAFAARRFLFPAAGRVNTGTLIVNTDPAGAQVFVDGQTRGATPITLSLNAGPHSIELRGGGEPRSFPLTIVAGTQVTQYLELPKTAPAVGQLQIRTEPAGAKVSVDGTPRGTSPTLITDLTPGEHTVALESDLGSVKQSVAIEGGVTSSLVVPLGKSDGMPLSGWLSVTAPVDVQLYENKKLVGSSASDRLMVTVGRHDIEFVNETLGYRATRTVQVSAGKVSTVKLDFPKGTIALNAIPWAEVWIDGEKVGETPIGNLAVTIGPHEVVFRHPDLGEQRHATTVTLNATARLSVDLRKK